MCHGSDGMWEFCGGKPAGASPLVLQSGWRAHVGRRALPTACAWADPAGTADSRDQSYRDRLSFLVFTSWWTFLFCGLYIAAFFVSSLNFVASIASHGIWIFLT